MNHDLPEDEAREPWVKPLAAGCESGQPGLTWHEAWLKTKADRDKLRAFAQRVMEAWPDGDVDGGELQEAAVACGLLELDPLFVRDGIEGYRRTPLLTGKE